MPTQILLIRHGETEWNRDERIQGQKDIPLSPIGEKQARLLGLRLKKVLCQAVYSSDLSRTRRTAEIALEGRSLPIVFTPALRERDFGRWEGLTWDQIQREFPAQAEQSRRDGVSHEVPGGETW